MTTTPATPQGRRNKQVLVNVNTRRAELYARIPPDSGVVYEVMPEEWLPWRNHRHEDPSLPLVSNQPSACLPSFAAPATLKEIAGYKEAMRLGLADAIVFFPGTQGERLKLWLDTLLKPGGFYACAWPGVTPQFVDLTFEEDFRAEYTIASCSAWKGPVLGVTFAGWRHA